MKYYIYVSDTKVDMLFPQISRNTGERTAVELGVNLKIASAKRTVEHESQDSRINKLEAVCAHIREAEPVGSIDGPRAWCAGVLDMAWGPITSRNGSPTGIVYFAGSTQNTLFALGGSEKHLLGSTPGSGLDLGSISFGLILRLLDVTRLSDQPVPPGDGKFFFSIIGASRLIQGPRQRLEFLARTLFHGEYVETRYGQEPVTYPHVHLATPIYVALAD